MQSAALNKQTNHGLPPMPRRPTEWRSLHMTSASDSLPAAPTTFREWKDLTKLSDAGISIPSPPSDHDIKTLSFDQNSFPPPDMINQGAGPQMDGPTADNPIRVTCLTDDQLLAVVRIRPSRSPSHSLDPNMDPKKIRRIVSNRESAQRSRIKKLRYVAEMERKLKDLEAEIGHLTPKIAHFRNHNHWLEMENKKLSEEVSSRSTAKWLKDAEIEKRREEVDRLKRLHFAQQQQQRKFQEQVTMNGWACGLEQMGQSPNFAEFGGPDQMGLASSIQAVRNGETSRPLEQCVEEAWNVEKDGETSNNAVVLQYVVDEQAWMTGVGGGGGCERPQKMSDLNLRSISSELIKLSDTYLRMR